MAATAVYYTADSLADCVMTFTSQEMAAEWGRIASKDLAILDEVGERASAGDLHCTTLKRFADLRDNEAGAVAIYISNVRPHQLGELYDDRIASRLLAGTIYELTGKDRRRIGC